MSPLASPMPFTFLRGQFQLLSLSLRWLETDIVLRRSSLRSSLSECHLVSWGIAAYLSLGLCLGSQLPTALGACPALFLMPVAHTWLCGCSHPGLTELCSSGAISDLSCAVLVLTLTHVSGCDRAPFPHRSSCKAAALPLSHRQAGLAVWVLLCEVDFSLSIFPCVYAIPSGTQGHSWLCAQESCLLAPCLAVSGDHM